MKIGFLWPADGLNEAEYLNFLPDNLNFHVQRFDAGTDTEDLVVEVLSAYADPENLALAASKLAKIKPDIFASGDHAACIIAGADGEYAMARAVHKATGVPCSLRELLDLIAAVDKRLAFANMNDFYFLSRAIIV